MAVALRLSRGGSKKRPFFRIVAADIRAPRDGRYLERLGTYNPMKSKEDSERITLNKERIKYWLSVGAQPTQRVTKFLVLEGMVAKPEIPKQTKQNKPRKKTIEKNKAKEEKLKSKQENVATPTPKQTGTSTHDQAKTQTTETQKPVAKPVEPQPVAKPQTPAAQSQPENKND